MVHDPGALSSAPLAAVVTFECVARHLRFARAATELRVTPTAVSKTIAQLEEHLGVRLLNRTTRSVSLTEAGARLLDAAGPALAELKRGLEDARTTVNGPAGTVRINTSFVAYEMLFEPHLRAFQAAYPNVVLDFTIDSTTSDIVGRGFDAGVRPGRALQKDVVAVAISPVQRLVVVGAPSYLARAGRPRQARDLLAHACILQRLNADGRFLAWTLRSGKQRTTLDVKGVVVLDDMRSALGAARAGVGLAYVFAQFAEPDLASGALERVLPGHELVREAFFFYYPSRSKLPPKLRVTVDWFRDRNA